MSDHGSTVVMITATQWITFDHGDNSQSRWPGDRCGAGHSPSQDASAGGSDSPGWRRPQSLYSEQAHSSTQLGPSGLLYTRSTEPYLLTPAGAGQWGQKKFITKKSGEMRNEPIVKVLKRKKESGPLQ